MKLSLLVTLIVLSATLLHISECSKFKALKKLHFKKLRKMISHGAGASSLMMAAGLIDDIGSNSHGKTWSFEYFDEKCAMISTQMNLINRELQAICNHLEAHEFRIQANHHHIIIIACVQFLAILLLFGVVFYLYIKTRGNHFQKRMENLVRTLGTMRDEYRHKLSMARARD